MVEDEGNLISEYLYKNSNIIQLVVELLIVKIGQHV